MLLKKWTSKRASGKNFKWYINEKFYFIFFVEFFKMKILLIFVYFIISEIEIMLRNIYSIDLKNMILIQFINLSKILFPNGIVSKKKKKNFVI